MDDKDLDRTYEEIVFGGKTYKLYEPTLRKARVLNAMLFDVGYNYGHLISEDRKQLIAKRGQYADYLRALNALADVLVEALELPEDEAIAAANAATDQEISAGVSALGRLINPTLKDMSTGLPNEEETIQSLYQK